MHTISDSGCWIWIGPTWRDGYGRIGDERAHRVFYREHVGEIPPTMLVCHSCDTTRCVNPSHMFLGSPADNMADKAAKRRSARNRGPCHNRRHRMLADADAERLRSMHSLGATYSQLASEFGIHWTQASRIARGKSGTRRILSAADIADIRSRVSAGASRRTIASEFGISVSAVGNFVTGHRGGPIL